MKANKDKCYLLAGGSHKTINVCGAELRVVIVTIYFKEHLSNILTKANRKINA